MLVCSIAYCSWLLVQMGAMMALRTALAYFLSKEIKELEEEEEKHEEKHNAGHAKQQVRRLKVFAHLCYAHLRFVHLETADVLRTCVCALLFFELMFCALMLCSSMFYARMFYSHRPHRPLQPCTQQMLLAGNAGGGAGGMGAGVGILRSGSGVSSSRANSVKGGRIYTLYFIYVPGLG